MGSFPGNSHASPRGINRVPRFVLHSIGLVLAALVAWVIWRGYQNPDLLLELGAFNLC